MGGGAGPGDAWSWGVPGPVGGAWSGGVAGPRGVPGPGGGGLQSHNQGGS